MTAVETLADHLAELTAAVGVTGEVLEHGIQLYVVLHDVPLPVGAFAVGRTNVLYITDKQYPLSAMDMFYTDLEVVRPDGAVPQNATEIEQHLERQWRRFSWHRNETWNSAGNPLLDHYAFMESRLLAEPREEAA